MGVRYGEARKRFLINGVTSAATDLHAKYLKPAREFLEGMKHQMRLGGLQQLSRRYVNEDGVAFTALSLFGQDEMRIDVPVRVGGGMVKRHREFPLTRTVICGHSRVLNSNEHAFSYINGEMKDLGTLGGAYSYAYDCTVTLDGYVIVGTAQPSSGFGHAFRYDERGVMENLGTLDGGTYSKAWGCSAKGDVIVGESETADGYEHACIFRNGEVIDLGTLGGNYSYAYGCSDDGSVIVGESWLAGDVINHAFVYKNGEMTDLGVTGDDNSGATDCSADGRIIVGKMVSGGFSRAFRYADGETTDLGAFGSNQSSRAYGCSADGRVVSGSAYRPGLFLDHAFRYEGGVMTDLGVLAGKWSNGGRCSEDGTMVVGFSNYEETNSSWTHAVLWRGGEIKDLGALESDIVGADGDAIAYGVSQRTFTREEDEVGIS